MRDSYVRWLCFRCDEPTLTRITQVDGIKAAGVSGGGDAPGAANRRLNPNAPPWWSAPSVPMGMDAYEVDRSEPAKTDLRYIWIDRRSKTVYAERIVLD